ncbi:MAG: Na+/H+ antiporter subunit D, partial [Pseudomonadota bacterium]
MTWYLTAPLVLPFLTAVASFLMRHSPSGRWVSVGGNVLLLIASILLIAQVLQNGVLAGQMGGWPAPFGITLVADRLSAVMVVITAITALAVSVYALTDINERKEYLGYHALFNVLIGGVTGAFITGDLF